MFSVLLDFQKINGHCNVSLGGSIDRKFYDWVGKQRAAKGRGELSIDREKSLNEIGFAWDSSQGVTASWEKMYSRLTIFKKSFGHCNVPTNYDEDKTLGGWVSTQRYIKKKGELSAAKIHLLDELGFEWTRLRSVPWEQMFSELLEFKKVYGHCKVPIKPPGNPKLYKWIGKQRYLDNKGKLTEERKGLLTAVGMEWSKKV